MKFLIYSCVFIQLDYLKLIELLLKSFKLFSRLRSEDVDYLIITSEDFRPNVMKLFEDLGISNGKIWCREVENVFQAACSRLRIFDYTFINQYQRILYLDCDILISGDLKPLTKPISDKTKVYVLEEGNILHHTYYWNGAFEQKPPDIPGFTTGIIYFENCAEIRRFFEQVIEHINSHQKQQLPLTDWMDQPFFVYNAVKNQNYDNQYLKSLAINNPSESDCNGIVSISHFCGGVGNFYYKYQKMKDFINYLVSAKKYVKLIEEDNYRSSLSVHRHIIDHLNKICIDLGEKVEGNCFSEHMNIQNEVGELRWKQMNHFSLGRVSNNIMEIGFNAGHSTLLYLISNPKSKVTVFDLCEHSYTKPCFEYLQSQFPGRLIMYEGDSLETVKNYTLHNPGEHFDLVHIDGCHLTLQAHRDFVNSYPLARDLIIWDDTQIPTLNMMLDSYIDQGLVLEIPVYKTSVYEHRIVKKNPISNKVYDWQGSHIMFLPGSKMVAFGEGTYTFLDSTLVRAHFGCRTHLLRFTDDFSKFISVRSGDFEVVLGTEVINFNVIFLFLHNLATVI